MKNNEMVETKTSIRDMSFKDMIKQAKSRIEEITKYEYPTNRRKWKKVPFPDNNVDVHVLLYKSTEIKAIVIGNRQDKTIHAFDYWMNLISIREPKGGD